MTKYITMFLLLLCATGLLAQVQVQPDAQFYGVQELALFKTYDRATYKKATGVDAPSYDPARRRKTWFDPAQSCDDPDAVAVYKTIALDATGKPTVKPLLLPACEAATMNLVGHRAYAPYVVAPTRAHIRGAVVDGAQLPDAPLNPDYLSLRSQADQLRAELGTSDAVREASPEGPRSHFDFPADEARRVWQIGEHNVGLLLKRQFALGVGRPGQWTRAGDDYVWTPDPLSPDGTTDARPSVPIPTRDLLPNEVLRATPFGIQVERLDKKTIDDGRFLEEDRRALRQILELLQRQK